MKIIERLITTKEGIFEMNNLDDLFNLRDESKSIVDFKALSNESTRALNEIITFLIDKRGKDILFFKLDDDSVLIFTLVEEENSQSLCSNLDAFPSFHSDKKIVKKYSEDYGTTRGFHDYQTHITYYFKKRTPVPNPTMLSSIPKEHIVYTVVCDEQDKKIERRDRDGNIISDEEFYYYEHYRILLCLKMGTSVVNEKTLPDLFVFSFFGRKLSETLNIKEELNYRSIYFEYRHWDGNYFQYILFFNINNNELMFETCRKFFPYDRNFAWVEKETEIKYFISHTYSSRVRNGYDDTKKEGVYNFLKKEWDSYLEEKSDYRF